MESPTFNEIRHGDCVAGLRSLPVGCVDLVFADPPFNIGYEYDVYDDRRERAHYLEWSREWISAVYTALVPRGTFWLAIGDEYAAELKVLSQDIGFQCRSWVVWYYTFGVNCTRKFSRSHAHLFHFVKDPENFTYRSEAPENRIPSARQLVYNDRRANPKGRLPDDTWILRPQDLSNCFTAAEDTWYFPRVAGTFAERAGFHGCQMPEQLLGRVIRASSEENDLVVDPFAGSATTLVVAKKLGRRYLGFDLSPDYVARGTARLEQARRGDRLEGAAEPLLSAPSTSEGRILPGVTTTGLQAAPKTKSKSKSQPLFAAQSDAETQAECQIVEQLDRGLLAAYRESYRGHTLDRVVTDPELHEPFLARCRASGILGDPRSWNLRMLELRRAGLLADLPVDEPTEFNWIASDDYLFASEIALAKSLAGGCPDIHELLAEPTLVAGFDALAHDLAPGPSAFTLRWSALKLVGHSGTARVRSVAFVLPKFGTPKCFPEVTGDALPTSPGVYLVTSQTGEALYVGQTLNQRRRLARQFSTSEFHAVWSPLLRRDELRFQFFSIDGGVDELLAYQSLLIRAHHPRLNLPLLGELGQG